MAMRVFSASAAILMLAFIFSSPLEAHVFKWVDSNGTTHYTDQPLGKKNLEWVGDSKLITYSKQPIKKIENKKTQVVPSIRVRPQVVQQPKKVTRNSGQTNVQGSASRRNYSRGTSTRGSARGTSLRGSGTNRY